jgi:hypothetical protein
VKIGVVERADNRVSPWDIAIAATTYGMGGMTAGKLLGPLAGLQPESQKTLQQTGMWGGLLTGAVKQLLGKGLIYCASRLRKLGM